MSHRRPAKPRYRRAPEADARSWVTCRPCNKRTHLQRSLAKRARRRTGTNGDASPVGERLVIYRCPVDSDTWHVGHTAAAAADDQGQ